MKMVTQKLYQKHYCNSVFKEFTKNTSGSPCEKLYLEMDRSSRPEVFCKKDVLQKFA